MSRSFEQSKTKNFRLFFSNCDTNSLSVHKFCLRAIKVTTIFKVKAICIYRLYNRNIVQQPSIIPIKTLFKFMIWSEI